MGAQTASIVERRGVELDRRRTTVDPDSVSSGAISTSKAAPTYATGGVFVEGHMVEGPSSGRHPQEGKTSLACIPVREWARRFAGSQRIPKHVLEDADRGKLWLFAVDRTGAALT